MVEGLVGGLCLGRWGLRWRERWYGGKKRRELVEKWQQRWWVSDETGGWWGVGDGASVLRNAVPVGQGVPETFAHGDSCWSRLASGRFSGCDVWTHPSSPWL